MLSNYDDVHLSEDLIKLLKTIYALTQDKGEEWVSWNEVARRQEGSDLLAPMVSAYAELPEAQDLMVQTRNGRWVKLTLAGQQWAATAPIRKETDVEKVARAVKAYAGRLWPQRLIIETVHPITKVGDRYVEAVTVQMDDALIPSDTPVKFRPKDGPVVHGRLVGQEPDGGTLYIAFENEVRQYQLPGVLLIERAFLLRELAKAIEKLEDIPHLSANLWKQGAGGITIARQDSVQVAEMLAALRTPWSHYLWGPPGSGKTYALGRLALLLAQTRSNVPILLVAPSNLAVDVALEQFVGQLEQFGLQKWLQERRVLRYGYPQKTSILDREELLGPPEQGELSREISHISRAIKQAAREESPEEKLATLRTELLNAQEQLRLLVREHLRSCVLVATTTTQAYMESSPIHEIRWDTVMVDEVTMVPPAVCLYLSHLATQRFLLAGDPRQLGPVYENGSKATADDYNWMGRDVFELGGVSKGNGARRKVEVNDVRLARITSQRRCTEGIWEQVSHLYPDVAIKTNEEQLVALNMLPPDPGQSVVILDVDARGTGASCEKVHESWQNRYTADLAIEVALAMRAEAQNEPTIAVITPYRAQVKLLHRHLREEQRAIGPSHITISAGTIHQFQGSEADVVIFDMVDGVGRNKLGQLLRDDTGMRLINVAVTRARGKVVLIVDHAWCKQYLRAADNPLLYDLIFGKAAPRALSVSPPSMRPSAKLLSGVQVLEQRLQDAIREATPHIEIQARYLIHDEKANVISRADFAFPEVKYAIYLDGAHWHVQGRNWQRDIRQRKDLTRLDWRFTIISRHEVEQDVAGWAATIGQTITHLK